MFVYTDSLHLFFFYLSYPYIGANNKIICLRVRNRLRGHKVNRKRGNKMNEYNGGFGSRRRRNLSLIPDHDRPSESVYRNTGWHNESIPQVEEEDIEGIEEETAYDIEEIEVEDQSFDRNAEQQPKELFIDGMKFVPKRKPKKELFMETHIRYTTYISKDVMQIIRQLHEGEQIESITHLINEAIKEHLLNHYNNDN